MINPEKIGWKHIIIGFLCWGLLMTGITGCIVLDYEDRIEALEKNRAADRYIIVRMDTMISAEGDTVLYETRIRPIRQYPPNK